MFSQFGIDGNEHITMLLQKLARVFATLTDPVATEAVPGAALFRKIMLHTKVDQIAFLGDALAINNVEFRFVEGGGNLILDDFEAGAIAGYFIAIFNGTDASNIGTHTGIKLQGTAAGGGFRIAEHDADFFTNLVDEDQAGVGF